MPRKFDVIFKNRDFTTRDPIGVSFEVQDYSFLDRGGPYRGTLNATGDIFALWALFNDLRCPVEIYDDMGALVWWGLVYEIELNTGKMNFKSSLSDVTNRVTVGYSYIEPGTNIVGQRRNTTPLDDLDSQAEYGIKELIQLAGGMSDDAANAQAAGVLAKFAWPKGGLSADSYTSGETRATIYLRGWWDTLAWKYASSIGASAISQTVQNSTQPVGTTTSTKVFESILPGTVSLNAKQIAVYASKTGTPADNLQVSIYTVWTGGVPVTQLATGTISGASITGSIVRYLVTLSAETVLDAWGIYAIQIDRSGAADNSNYYNVGVDTGLGYSSGSFKLWNGSAWVARSPNADMTFEVLTNDKTDSSNQIVDIISNFGQFMTGAELEIASGTALASFLDGSKTALSVINDLMDMGLADGRSLLATVYPNRMAYIWREPEYSVIEYTMSEDGALYTTAGEMVRDTTPPVGVYVKTSDIIPAVVNQTIIKDAGIQFISESGYRRGEPYYVFRDMYANPGVRSSAGSSAGSSPLASPAADKSILTAVSGQFSNFVALSDPLTSTAWDGDAYSTTSATPIDLSSVFGAPAGVKAVLVRSTIRDSGSAANDCILNLKPIGATASGLTHRCSGLANDAYSNACLIVPCDANGDIAYSITASGAGTMDVTLQVWGYWI